MSGDLSISEAVKLRRRSSAANSILVKEIAAADEKVLRLRRKLEKRKERRLALPPLETLGRFPLKKLV